MKGNVRDVVIVGGGDAGLLTAIGIQRMNPGVDVAVVDDFDREIPRVGKSTFREILPLLHGGLGIEERRFVAEARPIWKGAAYFRDWCDHDPFYYPFDPSTLFPGPHEPDTYQAYYHWYDERYADPDHTTIGTEIVKQRRSAWTFHPQKGSYDRYDHVAYHLNTERFNPFLREICRERGVSLVDDVIETVETSGNHVDRLRSKRQAYEADLYVDATGFNRVLKGEQDTPFSEFSSIPLDASYVAQVDRDLEDVIPATIHESGPHGWYWHIDTYDHRDLGYVYSTAHVSDEEAKETFLEHFDGEPIEEDHLFRYTFDSGYYERALEDNVLAVGNAAGFVEPLQAPALTTHAKAAVEIGSLLSSHGQVLDDWLRDTYNAWLNTTWESIYDFISVHYAYGDGDTEFWEAMRAIPLSDRIEHLIAEFDRSGLDRTFDPTVTRPEFARFRIYHPLAFYLIMRNMGAESAFYETNDFPLTDEFLAEKDQIDEATTEHVSGFLTIEEMYRGVVDSW